MHFHHNKKLKNSAPLNLTKNEFMLLKSLSKNDSLITQKSDKKILMPLLIRMITYKKCEIFCLIPASFLNL